jgi:hypothetical protein
MAGGSSSDTADRVGEFESGQNLQVTQQLYSAEKDLISQVSNAVSDVGKNMSSAISSVGK